MTAPSSTPQAVLDKIAQLQGDIEQIDSTIYRHRDVIDSHTKELAAVEQVRLRVASALDLALFFRDQYEAVPHLTKTPPHVETLDPEEDRAWAGMEAVETHPTGSTPITPSASPPPGENEPPGLQGGLKERVYQVMLEVKRPVKAAEIAEKLEGVGVSAIGTCFGHLSRARLIEQANDGAWVAKAGLTASSHPC